MFRDVRFQLDPLIPDVPTRNPKYQAKLSKIFRIWVPLAEQHINILPSPQQGGEEKPLCPGGSVWVKSELSVFPKKQPSAPLPSPCAQQSKPAGAEDGLCVFGERRAKPRAELCQVPLCSYRDVSQAYWSHQESCKHTVLLHL